MTDTDALMATILAHPDDDLPRLVFADWLEESGHPANAARAQFIRLQIEAAKHDTGSADALKLLHEADGYRASFMDEADEVLGGMRQAFHPGNVVRRRGFVDELRGTPETLLHRGGRVFDVAPVRAVSLGGFRHLNTLFKAATWTPRLRAVRVHRQPLMSSATRTILGCKALTGLAEFQFTRCELDDGWVLHFVSRLHTAAFADTLRELDLSGNPGITDAGANGLAAARGLDRLATLRLEYCGISAAGAQLLKDRFGERVVV